MNTSSWMTIVYSSVTDDPGEGKIRKRISGPSVRLSAVKPLHSQVFCSPVPALRVSSSVRVAIAALAPSSFILNVTPTGAVNTTLILVKFLRLPLILVETYSHSALVVGTVKEVAPLSISMLMLPSLALKPELMLNVSLVPS